MRDTVPFQPDKHGRKLSCHQIINSHDHKSMMVTQLQTVLRKGNVSPSIRDEWRVFGLGTNWKQHMKLTAKGVAVTGGRWGEGTSGDATPGGRFQWEEKWIFSMQMVFCTRQMSNFWAKYKEIRQMRFSLKFTISSCLHRASIVSKRLFIIPTDAHNYKIIGKLKQLIFRQLSEF